MENSAMSLLTAKEAADYLHVSLFTLGRMEKEGLLAPFRTPGGHRRYSQEMLDDYLEASRAQRANQERRILVVDEGDQLARDLAGAFPACRFAVARDELQVGLKLAEFKPHLVVVNNAARDIDAHELCQKLCGQSPDLKALPFPGPQRDDKDARGHAAPLQGLCLSVAAALGLTYGKGAG